MPKIIKDLRNKLIEETKKQALEKGYTAVTIRSVAAGCKVGVGTVYNYFSSKDELFAAFMLEDWNAAMRRVGELAAASDNAAPVVKNLYDELSGFIRTHYSVLSDHGAIAAFRQSNESYHGMLRRSMAANLNGFFEDPFTAEFIAEAMLTWTVIGKSYDDIGKQINKLI